MKGLYITLLIGIQFLHGQVGINTTNPQEALHIAGSTGTIRVESLNSVNNDYNPGDVDGDGDMDDDTVPLYVDENGDFTLQLNVLENSGSEDWIVSFFTAATTLEASNSTGCVNTLIESWTFDPISRPTLLQVKYNISHELFTLDNTNKISLSDTLARRVDNFIRITPDPDPNDNISDREYGPSSRTYTSGSLNSVQGPFYNGHTTYINLIPPTDNFVFTLEIWGRLCSNLDTGGESLVTSVKYAIDQDFIFLKLH